MTTSETSTAAKTPAAPAEKDPYSTYPCFTTHGPRDKSSYHGKAADWQRVAPKRTFGGKVS